MSRTIRIATRESQLAMWQAEFIRDRLLEADPDLEVQLLGMSTRGDRWLQAPLSEIGGKGLFIKELEAAMLAGQADIAVHSVKDLPAELPEGFVLPLVGFRDDVHDVLVSSVGDLSALPDGAKVGSSSLRRKTQLLAVRKDLRIEPIRGNVNTRLAKLDSGEFDAIVLAAAGLNRLGLRDARCYPLPKDVCLPAPGQGALGVECLQDGPVQALLEGLCEVQVDLCVRAERGVSSGLGADCSYPIAAHAHMVQNNPEQIALQGLVGDAHGTRILRARARGDDPALVAAEVVYQLYEQGAEEVLETLS